MTTVARAPVRIDPAGGGTDAPPYSVEYGGCVVNFAVARYAYAHLQWLPPGSGAHLHSLDLDQRAWAPTAHSFIPDGTLDFIKAFARRLLRTHDDFLLVTESDVPVRTGLGGSGAMGVAITTACLHALGKHVTQSDIATLANDVERHDLGLAGGCQDSFGAAIGGAKKILCHKGGGASCHPLMIPPSLAHQLERDMLLIYTGGVHLSQSIHADIKRSYALPNSPTIAAMDRLKAAAARMADALEAGDIDAFADCLNASRLSHYALHPSCDSDTLRWFFEHLQPHLRAGKTCGAGGGGFIAILAKPGQRNACTRIAEAAGGKVWPFKFDHEGAIAWTEPETSQATTTERASPVPLAAR